MENINEYKAELVAGYSRAMKRLIYLDYDGTLSPIKAHPQQAAPTALVRDLLQALGDDSRNRIVVISGREKETLEYWLGDLPVTLVAEHGAFYRELGQSWRSLFPPNPAWKDRIYPSLRALTFQYEGSFIEDKHYSLAWHYRAISDRIQEMEKAHILSAIRALPASNEFLLYDEDCTLEFRTAGIDKGRFAEFYTWAQEHNDFVLAMGDGKTDEDLFEALDKDHFTIRVGKSSDSSARFFLERQEDVPEFFRVILASRKEHTEQDGST